MSGTTCHACGGVMVRETRPLLLKYEWASFTVKMWGWYCACGESTHTGEDMVASDRGLKLLKEWAKCLAEPAQIPEGNHAMENAAYEAWRLKRKALVFMPVQEAARRLVNLQLMDDEDEARELVLAVRVRGYVSYKERNEFENGPNDGTHDVRKVPLYKTYIRYEPQREEAIVDEEMVPIEGKRTAPEINIFLCVPSHVNYCWILNRLLEYGDAPATLLEWYRTEFITLFDALTALAEINGASVEEWGKSVHRWQRTSPPSPFQLLHTDDRSSEIQWKDLPPGLIYSEEALKYYNCSSAAFHHFCARNNVKFPNPKPAPWQYAQASPDSWEPAHCTPFDPGSMIDEFLNEMLIEQEKRVQGMESNKTSIEVEGKVKTPSPVPTLRRELGPTFPRKDDFKWENVIFTWLSDDKVRVSYGNTPLRLELTYGQLGFKNYLETSIDKPIDLWALFRDAFTGNGFDLTQNNTNIGEKYRVYLKHNVSKIRNILKAFFHTEEDPFKKYNKDTAWEPKFVIRDERDSER